MRKTILLLTVATSLAMACCTPQRDKDLSGIQQYENSIDLQNNKVDTEVGNNLIMMYTDFATKYPTDSLAPMYIMKAADVAANIGNPATAIEYLDKVITDYPSFEKRADCYFFKGFIYETVAHDLDKAKEAYTAFIEEYPSHPMVNNAKTIINNLSLSDEELIKMIMEKNNAAL